MTLIDTRLQHIDLVELQLLLSPNLSPQDCARVVELGRMARRAVANGTARPVVVRNERSAAYGRL